MKKTLQSKLTAALFAAAISTGTGGTLSPQLAKALDAANDITTIPETTYGPPGWMMTTDENETSTTTETTEMPIFSTEAPTVTMTTSTSEMPVYGTETPTVTETTATEEVLQLSGEPVLYDEPGDVNMNGCIDVHDLTLLKQYLLNQTKYKVPEEVGDINEDGKIDKADVKALIRLLTGKPEDDAKETTVTTTVPTTFIDTDVTITTTMRMTTLYGPPRAWD